MKSGAIPEDNAKQTNGKKFRGALLSVDAVTTGRLQLLTVCLSPD
jgi:hypothetical protein